MSARVTQADRIAAVGSVYGTRPGHAPAEALEWASTGDDAPLLELDAIGCDRCCRRASEFADHRERSTAALREAAERLCAEIEGFEPGRFGWEYVDLVMLSRSLRAALAGKGDK